MGSSNLPRHWLPIIFLINAAVNFETCLTNFFCTPNFKNVFLGFSRKESSSRTLPWHLFF